MLDLGILEFGILELLNLAALEEVDVASHGKDEEADAGFGRGEEACRPLTIMGPEDWTA